MTSPEGNIRNPLPDDTRKLEPKVKYGAIATYVASAVLLFIVNLVTGNGNELLIAALPDNLEMFVLPLVPAISTLAAGFAASHQWRQSEVKGAHEAP